MYFVVLLVCIGNFLTDSWASEHPFPTENVSPKKQKLYHKLSEIPALPESSSSQILGESELLRQIGDLAKEFHEFIEEKVRIPLNHPAFPKKRKEDVFTHSYAKVRQLIETAEEQLRLQRETIEQANKTAQWIKEELEEGYSETYPALLEALQDYKQSSYEGLVSYIKEIEKGSRREENLRNYLVKQKEKNTKFVEEKITRAALIKFIKRKNKNLKELIKQKRISIETILDNLGL